MPISDAARSCILRRIREYDGTGGRLIFDAQGRGGTYYGDEDLPNIDATDIVVRPRADRTAEEILEAALSRTDIEQTNCEVCGKLIPIERIIAARSRGVVARYESDRCRNVAAKRRQRDARPRSLKIKV